LKFENSEKKEHILDLKKELEIVSKNDAGDKKKSMRDFETPKKYIETNLYPYGGTDPQNYGNVSPRIKELLIGNESLRTELIETRNKLINI